MSLLGFFVVLLAVLFGVAAAYDLKSRHRHRGLPGESRQERRQGARRAAQDRRSDARARLENIQNDAGGIGGGFDF